MTLAARTRFLAQARDELTRAVAAPVGVMLLAAGAYRRNWPATAAGAFLLGWALNPDPARSYLEGMSDGLASTLDPDDLLQSYAGYQKALTTLSISQLLDLSTRQSIAIQQHQDSMLSRLLRAPSSMPDLDQPVIRSTPMATPSSERDPGRGQPASPSHQPQSLELLARRGGRMGPRLGAKLVIADARRRARGS